MIDPVLHFIHQRFQNDCNWLSGNCYYFAVILKSRFPEGKIYYDVIHGHFVFQYQCNFYDWGGLYHPNDIVLTPWDDFSEYDPLQKERIEISCIM